MSNKLEMEIKLITNKKNLPKLLAYEPLKKAMVSGSKKTLDIENYYYDTLDYKISNAKMAYRVRKTGKAYEATVKTQSESWGGFSAREEYTVPLKKQEAITRGFSSKIDAALEKLLQQEELQVIFSVHVTRQVINLQITKETLLEMAIDEGEILAGDKTAPISEVELEILEGTKGDLLDFVAAMGTKIPLHVEPKSKFARGLELLNGKGLEINKNIDTIKIEKNGNVEKEMKKLISYYANTIIELQTALLDKDNLANADKLVLGNIKKLRAMINFVHPLLEKERYEFYRELIIKINEPVQELYVLKRFIRQWKRISKNNAMVLRSSKMLGCLEEREEIILKAISKQITSGYYASCMFKILANVENSTWKDSKHLQLNEFALNRLKDWHDALLKIKVTSEKLDEGTARKMRRLAESMVMIRSDVKIGRLDKETFVYLKALNRNLKVLSFDIYGHKDVLAFLQGTTNRGLYRDAGLLLGYRLSEMPKAWRKVSKSWNKVLKGLKK